MDLTGDNISIKIYAQNMANAKKIKAVHLAVFESRKLLIKNILKIKLQLLFLAANVHEIFELHTGG
jgi:hypothetical protein